MWLRSIEFVSIIPVVITKVPRNDYYSRVQGSAAVGVLYNIQSYFIASLDYYGATIMDKKTNLAPILGLERCANLVRCANPWTFPSDSCFSAKDEICSRVQLSQQQQLNSIC